MRSDSRSAAAIVGRFVFARGTSGKTEASATHRPSTPSTRPEGSTTVRGSSGAPMRQVPQM